jgi:hypothetical protein
MAFRITLGIVALVIAAQLVRAHDHWINNLRLTDPASGEWCCNHIDCRPEKVSEVAGGFTTEAGDFVPYSRVIWLNAADSPQQRTAGQRRTWGHGT